MKTKSSSGISGVTCFQIQLNKIYLIYILEVYVYNLHTHNLLGLSFFLLYILDNSELIYELIKPPNESLPLQKNCIFLTHSINVKAINRDINQQNDKQWL